MSSVKSSSSAGDSTWKELDRHDGRSGEIIKMGYLKKLKTMRKKFFVLRGESSEASARLEYYDSEKKWRSHHSPKRTISLKTCFNINKRLDTKHKYVIALYTKDDCFCLVLESEEDLEDWLTALLSLQHGEDMADGEQPKPTFEHVWQVTVQKKGLGNSRNILGPYLLCLTDKMLSLVKMSQEEKPDTYEFSLMSIRRCGHSDCFFYMEVGRSSCTGAGDLWMQTEDTNIAQNMHASILSAMSNNSLKEEQSRLHASANEASKPITMLNQRQSQMGSGKSSNYYSTSEEATRAGVTTTSSARMSTATYCEPSSSNPVTSHTQDSTAGRERCDSMPSRARTTSEGHHQALHHSNRNMHLVPSHSANRPHSMYSRGISYSPPVGSSPVSPASGACSTDSAGSSLSIDDGENWSEGGSEGVPSMGRYGHSLTPDEPVIMEENCDEYGPWPGPGGQVDDKLNYLAMDRTMPSLSLPIQPVVPNTAMGAPHRKISPNLSSSGFKSGSPSQGSYMEMCSPCGSSPLDTTGGYMTMSPGGVGGVVSDATRMQTYARAASSANHSRGSSLAEDGYVPMAPALTDDGYVDMDPMQPSNIHEHFQHSEMSPASSCSITSGTPSTDMRFSEYHLEKVSSFFTPSEEDETSLNRPIRAYSVGSRPDTSKKSDRLEIANQAADASRLRAFSVGSRAAPGIKLSSHPLAQDVHMLRHHPSTLTPPSQHHMYSAAPSVPGNKSSSAPLLSTSWSGSSSLRHAHAASRSSGEPMDDLMEMDFTRNIRLFAKFSSSAKKAPPSLPPHHHQPPGPLDRLSTPPVSCAANTGYMEMTPRAATVSSPKPLMPTCGPYMEMKAGAGGDLAVSSPPSGSLPTKVSPKSSVICGPYMEMKSGTMGDFQSNLSESPSQTKPILVPHKPGQMSSVSPKSMAAFGPYVDMRSSGGFAEMHSRHASSPPTKASVPICGRSPKEEAPYVEMRAGAGTIPEGPTVFPGVTRAMSVPVGVGSYMDMRGGHSDMHSPFAATPGTSPKSSSAGVSPYVDMRTVAGTEAHHQNFSVISCGKPAGNRKPTSPIQEEYMDMSIKPDRKMSRQEGGSKEPVVGVVNRTAPLDTPQPKKPPEGYMEMSWDRGSKPSQKSSLEDYKSSSSAGQEDYMNMSFEGRGSFGSRKKEKRGSRKEKARYSSQPIAIQSAGSGPPKDASGGKTSSASTSPVFSLSNIITPGRKSSTGTPPKIPPGFLPLGGSSSPSTSPFSSLRRSRNRKTSSGQRSEGGSRRESCDMNSGLTTPTGSTATIFPFSLNSPGSPMKPFPGVSGTKSSGSDTGHVSWNKCPVDATSGTVHILYSYPEMQLSSSPAGSASATPDSSSSSEQPTPVNTEAVDDSSVAHDYVNYTPQQDDVSESTMVRSLLGTFHEVTRKTSAPSLGAPGRRANSIHQGVAGLTLSSPTLSSSKGPASVREATPPFTRKSSLSQPLPSSSPLFRPLCKPSPDVSNGPKVAASLTAVTGKGTALLSRQLSDAGKATSSSSCKEPAGGCGSGKGTSTGRQLSRSSSGSSETGRNQSVSSVDSIRSQEESLSAKSDGDSGTISPASSQTAVSSRPPSVSSERELHYASLDLAPSGSEGEEGARSPRSFKTPTSVAESSASSPSPNPGDAFSYAEIDFTRSEGLRNASARTVRH